MTINDIYGLYIGYNATAYSRILIGVSENNDESTAKAIAEAYRIDMNMDGEFKIEAMPKDFESVKGIEFSCSHLLTESTYNI